MFLSRGGWSVFSSDVVLKAILICAVVASALVLAASSPPAGAQAPAAGPELTVVHSCLDDNGRIDTTFVNTGAAPATYRLEFTAVNGIGTLSPREAVVAPGDWGRIPITGRPDGAYTHVVLRDGAPLSSRTVSVACDSAPPAVAADEVSIISSCRQDNGFIIVQLVNPAATPRGYVIEFDDVPNRSTTAPAYGAATRAVTGRPDGTYTLRVRVGGNFISTSTVTVACDPGAAVPTPTPTPVEGGAPGSDATWEFENRCIGGFGGFYFDVTNPGPAVVNARLSVSGLSDLTVAVPAGTSSRLQRTGRPQGAYTVTGALDGQVVFSSTETVSCGQAPVPPTATPIATPLPTATPTPTPAATATPTPTPGNLTVTGNFEVTCTSIGFARIRAMVANAGDETVQVTLSATNQANGVGEVRAVDIGARTSSQLEIRDLPAGSYLVTLSADATMLQSRVETLVCTTTPMPVPATATPTPTQTPTPTPTPTPTTVPQNQPPTAVDDTATVPEDGAAQDIDLTDNDSDPDGDNVEISAVDDGATTGDVEINADNDSVTYDPNGEFESLGVGEEATDTFSYTVTDGNGNEASADVTITITGANDAPVGVADTATANEDGPAVLINLIDNDTDVDANAILTIDSIDDSQLDGELTPQADNQSVIYDPNGSFESLAQGEQATDTFTYAVCDENNACDIAITVTVTIIGANDVPANQAPTAVDDTATVPEDGPAQDIDLTGNDSDPDSDDVEIQSIEDSATAGNVTVNADNDSVSYDPAGEFESLGVGESDTDTFSYNVTDGNGATATATATVTITGTNDAPVGVADTATANEDGPAVLINLIDNDTDVDANAILTIDSIDDSQLDGELTPQADNQSVIYDPNGSFESLAQGEQATDTFTYTVCDENNACDIAITVTVTIIGANDVPANQAPIAVDDFFLAVAGIEAELEVLANDTDPDIDPLFVQSVSATREGAAADPTLGATAIGYTAPAGFTGFDTFTYTVEDGFPGGVDTANVVALVGTEQPFLAEQMQAPQVITVEPGLLNSATAAGIGSVGAGDPLAADSTDIIGFEVLEGQDLFFDFTQCFGAIYPRWEILNADNIVVTSPRACSQDAQFADVQAGLYALRIYSNNAQFGDYALTVWDVPEPDGPFSLAPGDAVTQDDVAGAASPGAGNIESPLAIDQYTFSADGTTDFFVNFTSCFGAIFPKVRVVDSFGDLVLIDTNCGNDTSIDGLAADTYTLEIFNDDDRFGTYDFTFTEKPEPDGPFPLEVGDSVITGDVGGEPSPGAGDIESPFAVDQYTFGTDGNTDFFIDFTSCFGAIFPKVRVINGAGDTVLVDNNCNNDTSIDGLPAGDYTLEVFNDDDRTGRYDFIFYAKPDPDGPFPIEADDAVSQDFVGGAASPGAGNIESPFAADRYTFSTNGGTDFLVDFTSCFGAIYPQVRVLNSAGNIVGDATNCNTDRAINDLPAGNYTLELFTDNDQTGAYTFTFTSTAPDPNVRSVTGTVLDATAQAGGSDLPVVGATVMVAGMSGDTNAAGVFTIANVPIGVSAFEIVASGANLAPNGQPYTDYANAIEVPAGADEHDLGTFFATPRTANTTTIDPNATTIVDNPEIGPTAQLEVAPMSARTVGGDLYNGELSITVVPNCCTPSSMPQFVVDANPLIVTVQPLGIVFDPPAPLSLPNTSGLLAGEQVDLWSLNPDTGAFEVVGVGEVSVDGTTIATISGGLRQTDWHFFIPEPSAPGTPNIVFGQPTFFAVPAGEPISQSVFENFSDPEGDVLTFSIPNPPAGFSIGALTGVIAGPGLADDESVQVTVEVSDGALTTSRNFTFTGTTTPIYIGPQSFFAPNGGDLVVDFNELFVNPGQRALTFALTDGVESPSIGATLVDGVATFPTDNIQFNYDFFFDATNENGTSQQYLQIGLPFDLIQGPSARFVSQY